MISDARHRSGLILIYIVFPTVCNQLQSPNAAPRPSTVKQELLMAPPKRGARAADTGDGNRRSPSRITRKIRELRQKLLSAMRSDKVRTGLCEVTVLLRSDCEQKCHFSGASARCYRVRSVTLLIRSTIVPPPVRRPPREFSTTVADARTGRRPPSDRDLRRPQAGWTRAAHRRALVCVHTACDSSSLWDS